MKYPDGKALQVGDLVWWNEGACVGFVQWIWDPSRDGGFSWAKTNGPPVFILNRHPYEASDGPDGVMHDECSLGDEGVGLLSEKDLDELQSATELARSRSRVGFGGRHYAVQARSEDCQMIEWHFLIFEGDTCLEELVVTRQELAKGSGQAGDGDDGPRHG